MDAEDHRLRREITSGPEPPGVAGIPQGNAA